MFVSECFDHVVTIIVITLTRMITIVMIMRA